MPYSTLVSYILTYKQLLTKRLLNRGRIVPQNGDSTETPTCSHKTLGARTTNIFKTKSSLTQTSIALKLLDIKLYFSQTVKIICSTSHIALSRTSYSPSSNYISA